MATFVAIKNSKQTVGALAGVLKYVSQERKTKQGDLKFISGHNCVPQCAYTEMQAHRNANDAICQRHGLSILQKAERHEKKRRMTPGEYQAGLRGESWKLDLILAINEALEYADDRESFIENMEQEGYQVVWTDTRKHITFITPEGRRCRDSSLHDETFLKQNLEMLFLYRQTFGFTPATEEPDEGWLGELAQDAARFGRYLGQAFDTPDLPPIPTWSESKQRSREALKKLAHGQKLTNEESYGYDFGW